MRGDAADAAQVVERHDQLQVPQLALRADVPVKAGHRVRPVKSLPKGALGERELRELATTLLAQVQRSKHEIDWRDAKLEKLA